MKQTITVQIGAFVFAILMVLGMSVAPALAHNGEDHATEAEATAHASESGSAEIAKLEQTITLLKQLILLINAIRIQQWYATVVIPVVEDTHDEMEDHHTDESMHHDEDVNTSDETEHLVIEIEPHNDKTHAHVRYVDKPEEMFFVDSDITDEDGIVADIHERTGLSEDEIVSALKYMQ